MQLTPVQNQAITARMARVVGDAVFNRLFGGVRFEEVDGNILFVYAKDARAAAEMENSFAPHISTVATDILRREVSVVLVLPEKLALRAPDV